MTSIREWMLALKPTAEELLIGLIALAGLCALLFGLTGCATDSGVAHYKAKPVITPNGDAVCCEVDIKNTKNVGKVDVTAKKDRNGNVSVRVIEESVDASGAIESAAKATEAAAAAVSTAADRIIPLLPASPRQ